VPVNSQVALVDVFPTTQPDPTQAAAIEKQREAAFNQFGAKFERLSGNPRKQACSIVVDRTLRRIVAIPAENSSRFGLETRDLHGAPSSPFTASSE